MSWMNTRSQSINLEKWKSDDDSIEVNNDSVTIFAQLELDNGNKNGFFSI